MAPSNPKRPPRPPGPQAPREESELELPFDDDEVMPLQADDPRPQRVPQFPAGTRRRPRQKGTKETGRDRELSPRFDTREYSDPGYLPAFLYVERGPGAGQLVPVKQGVLVLGRSSTSDFRLQHPSISRRHAQLVRQGDRFTLRDLGSQNGTFVNRARISGEVELHFGDEIAVGNALLKLRGSGAAEEAPPPPKPSNPPSPSPVLPPRRRTTGMSITRVALIAAAVGSAVAALLTLAVVKLVDPAETVTVVEPETGDPAQGATEEPSGAQGAGAASPTEAPTPKRSRGASSKEPSALAVASQGKEQGSRRGASTRESGGARVRSAEVSAQEEDILTRYEAGDIAEALELARRARLESLASRIAAFQAAETAGQKALANRDTAGALKHLATAFHLDQQLSYGWSTQGRELRKQLGNLHTVVGLDELGAGRTAAAREAFETALKYDSSNAQAKSHLSRLEASAPAAK
jgi:hypothetical protein